MDGAFTGWRRKCGIGALVAALAVAGAWIKSAVDDATIPRYSPHAPPRSGNIILSGYNVVDDTSPLVPQVHWTIIGLYSDANITFASAEPNTRRRDASIANVANDTDRDEEPLELPAFFGPGPQLLLTAPAPQGSFRIASPTADDEGIIPAIVDGASSDFVLLASGNQPRVGISIEHDRFVEDSDDDMADDPDAIKSQSHFCGFAIERLETPDGSWQSQALIPHGSLVFPFGLLSALLLWSSRRRPQSAPSASVVPRIDSNKLQVGVFCGWRRKLGAVTLLLAVAFAAGWARSFVVTDLLSFDMPADTRGIMASCREGLVVKQDAIPGSGGYGLHYRTRTGQAHDRIQFRPNGGSETSIVPAPPTLPLPGTAVNLTEPIVIGAVDPPSGQSNEVIEAQPTIYVPIAMTSPTDFVGTDCDWCGIYIGYGPSMKTLVIPYGFLVIPLTVVSASLLIRRPVKGQVL